MRAKLGGRQEAFSKHSSDYRAGSVQNEGEGVIENLVVRDFGRVDRFCRLPGSSIVTAFTPDHLPMTYRPSQFQRGLSFPEFLRQFGHEEQCIQEMFASRWRSHPTPARKPSCISGAEPLIRSRHDRCCSVRSRLVEARIDCVQIIGHASPQPPVPLCSRSPPSL